MNGAAMGSFMSGYQQGQNIRAKERQMQELEETRKLRMDNMRLNNEMRQSQITKNRVETEQAQFKMALPGISALSASSDKRDWQTIYKQMPSFKQHTGLNFVDFAQPTDVPGMIEAGVLKRQVENKDGTIHEFSDEELYGMAKAHRIQKFIDKDGREKFMSTASIEATTGITAFRTEEEKKRIEAETTKYKNETAKLKLENERAKAKTNLGNVYADVAKDYMDTNGNFDLKNLDVTKTNGLVNDLAAQKKKAYGTAKVNEDVDTAVANATIFKGFKGLTDEMEDLSVPGKRFETETESLYNKYVKESVAGIAGQFNKLINSDAITTPEGQAKARLLAGQAIDAEAAAMKKAAASDEISPELKKYLTSKAQISIKTAMFIKKMSGAAVTEDERKFYMELFSGGFSLSSMNQALTYMKGSFTELYNQANNQINAHKFDDLHSSLVGALRLKEAYPDGNPYSNEQVRPMPTQPAQQPTQTNVQPTQTNVQPTQTNIQPTQDIYTMAKQQGFKGTYEQFVTEFNSAGGQ